MSANESPRKPPYAEDATGVCVSDPAYSRFIFSKLFRRIAKICLLLVAIAIYLNIGWAVVNYYDNYVLPHGTNAETFWQKVWSGPENNLQNKPNSSPAPFSLFLVFVLIWPFLPLVSLAAWFFYFIYYALWFIFWGGAAKLLGLA